MPPKPFWQSKTFWFNVLAGAAELPGNPIGGLIPPGVALPIVLAANLALRFVTKTPIVVRPKTD